MRDIEGWRERGSLPPRSVIILLRPIVEKLSKQILAKDFPFWRCCTCVNVKLCYEIFTLIISGIEYRDVSIEFLKYFSLLHKRPSFSHRFLLIKN